MNEPLSFYISQFSIIETLLAGVVVYGFLRMLKSSAGKFISGRRSLRLTRRLLPILELIVWASYLVFGLSVIFRNELLFSAMLLLIVAIALAWFSWFVFKDWVAGLITRFRAIHEPNQPIKVDDVEGVVRKMGDLTMEIARPDGEIVEIPYSLITSRITPISAGARQHSMHSLIIDVPRDARSLPDIQKQLRRALMLSPWWLINQDPQIRLLSEDEGHYQLEARLPVTSEEISARLARHIAQIPGISTRLD